MRDDHLLWARRAMIADHVLLRLSDFADDPPIFITVRTRTKEGAVSSDSNVSRVPRGISSTTDLTSRTNALSIQPNPLNLVASMSATDGPPSSSLVPPLLGVSGGTPIATTTTGLLQTAQGTVAAKSLINNSMVMAQPSVAPYGTHTITAGSNMLSRYPALEQMQVAEHQLLQTGGSATDTGATGGGAGGGGAGGGLLTTIGAQSSGLAVAPVTNTLNSYTAAGLAAANNPMHHNISGNSKFGYSSATGMLYDGLLKSYQTPSSLHEQWKTQNQYYTFHPRALRRELTSTEEKPSVLEMEHNYLLKHRAQPWPPVSQTSRARFEHYLRGHPDDRTGRSGASFPSRTLLPVSVARVRSEELCSTRSEPDLRPMALDDFSCRWFVALFDYSHHMSPNANAQQEELSFRKHQLIKVFGDIDQDGFYTGQIGHRIGLVPSNMVIEIAKDDLMPPPRRRSDATGPVEPSLRRMRWGSLKSRSYDHAGDRRPPRYRMITVDGDQYPSIDRREHSLPSRPGEYFGLSSRRMHVGDYEAPPPSHRSDYGGRVGAAGAAAAVGADEPYDVYPNGRHPRDYYGYTRDHRSREGTVERDRRDYYVDERDLSARDRAEFYEPEGTRDPRERDMRGYRDMRDSRETRDYRDARDPRYQRESSMARRDRDYMDEHDDQRMRDYREPREYREQREVADYRDMRKERERDTEQSIRDQRSYDRRPDYGRMEKGPGPIRDYAATSVPQSHHPAEAATTADDLRHGRINGDMQVRKFVAKFDYDSRQLSPNVDAEQVELSFHAGDVITVYGEMDEDGFYMGELNGSRGLVPSNFLHTSPPNSLMPSQMPPQQQQQQQQQISSQIVPPITIPVPEQQIKTKGVAFQDNAKKTMPTRQSSQTTSSTKPSGQAAMKPKGSASAQKTISKKPSDVGPKSSPNARKTSQSSKKESGAKKKS